MSKVPGLIKYLTIAAILILLLLFAFLGFLSYQDHASYKNAVHQDAGLIIKIDRNQLIRKIGFNALTNPGYYFRADEEDSLEVDEKEERRNGFDTRANIFIFSLKEAPFTFYATFKVTDSAALKTFLKDKFQIDSYDASESYSYGISPDRKLQAAFNQQRLVVSYAFQKRHSQEAIEQILLKKNLLGTDDPGISRLKKFDGDVVFISGKNAGSLNFENGRVLLSALLQQIDGYSIPEQARIAAVDTSSSFHLALAGGFSSSLFKTHTVNEFNIPLDSIMDNYQGYLDLKASGKVLQADTIITYEYNDDFEKIEVKTLQEKSMPGVSLMMKANAAEIQRLLSRHNILQGSQINRRLFPLLKLNFEMEDEATIRITNKESSPVISLAEGEIFSMHADFHKLHFHSAIPIPEAILEDLQKLRITASPVGDEIAVDGELTFTNEEINALMQLMNW